MADYLRKRANIEARLDAKGKMGELTVWVGDRLVVRKGLFKFPKRETVLAAIQEQLD